MTIAERVIRDRELRIEKAIEALLEMQEEAPSIVLMETITSLEEIKGSRC